MSTFFIALPLMVFLIFVAPLWLFFHYRSKRNTNNTLSSDEYAQLQQLSQRAEQMQYRVATLEKILDAESPTWRKHYE